VQMLLVGVDDDQAAEVQHLFESSTGSKARRLFASPQQPVDVVAFDRELGAAIVRTRSPASSTDARDVDVSSPKNRLLVYIGAACRRDANANLCLVLSGDETLSLAKLAHQLTVLPDHEVVLVVDTQFASDADADAAESVFRASDLGDRATDRLTVWFTGSPGRCFASPKLVACIESQIENNPDKVTWCDLRRGADTLFLSLPGAADQYRSRMYGGTTSVAAFLNGRRTP
jgi:hypothetical protein